MTKNKIFATKQERNTQRRCWIIDQDLNVRHVVASYTTWSLAWSYLGVNKTGKVGGSDLRPFEPNYMDNSSFWGDGCHYRTKKAALKDLPTLIRSEIKRTKRWHRDRLEEELRALKKKLKRCRHKS